MKNIPVFFNPQQQVSSNDSYSPSAQKPLKAIQRWQDKKYAICIKDFEPVSVSLLHKVHDPHYVDGVFALTRDNGFDNRNPAVAASLPWTTGSLLAAAKEALSNKQVACSPTSGFHHAYYHRGGDYCTFNGLLATVFALYEQNLIDCVGILDLDAHWADGTEDVIKHVPVLNSCVKHYNFGGDVKSFTSGGIASWMKELPNIVESMVAKCDLVIYQAGADPHLDDPLGGFMSSQQMRTRDHIVFETCRKAQVPVAWNLAGGYQEPFQSVLDIHDATMEECIASFITQ